MVLPVLLLAGAQAFDYVTFLVMAARHGIGAEANPLVIHLAESYGLPGVTAAKLFLIGLVGLTAIVIGRQRPKLAALVIVAGVTAGTFGGVSNIVSF